LKFYSVILTLTFNSLNFKIFNYDFSSFEIIKFFSLHTKLFSFSLFVFQLEKKLEKIFSNKPKSELISIIKMITTDHALCRSGTWKYRLSSFCSATTSCIKVCRYQLINLTRNAFSLYHIKLNIEFIYLFYKWYKRYFHIMCIIN
jgi:hypothetical protein